MDSREEHTAKNISLLKRRWPEIGRLVAEAPLCASATVDESGPQATLVWVGLRLGSGYDREKEARLLARLIPEASTEAWIYGFGLGDLQRVLLERCELQRLSVIIMNCGVARFSCRHFDHSDWLADPRVELVAAENLQQVRMPFTAVPPCLQLAGEGAARLRDQILLALSTHFIRQKHSENREQIRTRLEENTRFVDQDGDVASLFDGQPGATIAVAAAGPTLAHHYEYLRSPKNTIFLVAVDAALKPLVAEGIRPDVVVSIDGNEKGVLPFFEKVALEGFQATPLVYFPRIPSSVLSRWPGPPLTAYSDGPIYKELAKVYPKGELFSSGSVIHPAVDLAVRMGAARIVLLGADFSFPGKLSHVPGCETAVDVPSGSEDWVLDGRGHRTKTLPNLRGYLRDLEDTSPSTPKSHSSMAAEREPGLWEPFILGKKADGYPFAEMPGI